MCVRKSAVAASVALMAGFSGGAPAQEVKVVEAGVDEVTLPPVVVTAPKERIVGTKPVQSKQKPSSSSIGESASAGGGGGSEGLSGAVPAEGGEPAEVGSSSGVPGVFTLGQIDMIGGTAISNEAMRTFSKDSVDQALALAPGVAATNSGGPRNEQLIFVRGFDRWQVPISVDGIRIYRPADNRFDFSAFLTPDMSEVQIAKGYTSVLNGPGGMGGAINLVTKKPQKAVEGEVQGGLTFGTDGEYEGYKTYLSAGTRQSGYYAQASGILIDNDGWYLSDQFDPTAIEDGGERDHSNKKTWQLNAKIGLTPNKDDDYSINYTRGEIARGSPYHVADPIGIPSSSVQRNWEWAGTTTENIYWLSHTKVGDASFIDTKAYYSKYSDLLKGYDDPTFTTQNLANSFVFDSHYNDWAAGGSVTAGTDITPWDTFKASFYYRRDVHTEYNDYNSSVYASPAGCSSLCFSEPTQSNKEDTFSVAAENTFHVTKELDWIAGISYDWRHLMEANDFVAASKKGKTVTPAAFINYNLKDSDALNWQTMLVYRLSPDETVHASVSDRTRFPTIFERFSSRFGGATSNPGLQQERALNYEIGYASAFAPGSQFATAVFFSDVTDIIQSVPISGFGTNVSQSQNVGDGQYYGAEASIDYALTSYMLVGGNITWVHRDVNNPTDASFQLTGMPEVKGIAYATYRLTDAWSITPSIEFATERWTTKRVGSTTLYYETGDFALVNLQTEYDFTPNTSLTISARNLFDEDYVLTDGFPEAGRTFFVNMRAKF